MNHTHHMLAGGLALGMILLPASAFGQNAPGATTTLAVPRGRPANVPDGYAVTPFGFFHPSCIQGLSKGDRLLPDGRVQHADGSTEVNVATCNYAHYTSTGMPAGAGVAAPSDTSILPEVNGWVENANVTPGSANQSYGALIATWTVPPHPPADDGQVVFFFPGLEDINNTESILQPVLEWTHRQWTIASWNCCLNNVATSSPAVPVSPGDVIYGSVTSNCPAGTLSCPTWNVLTLDMSSGQSTTLRDTPSDGQVFNWAFGGVLEPYFVVSCSDYPSNGRISFDSVTVFDEQLHPIARPKWTETFNSTMTPQCGYGVKATRHEVKLQY